MTAKPGGVRTMRNLFLGLVLINLFLLAWYSWIEAPDQPLASRSAGSLALLAEGDPPSAPAPSTPGARANPDPARGRQAAEQLPDSPGAAPLCFRVGPWADEAAARQVEELLANRGMNARLIARETQIWLGHWVQVGGFGSTAEAEAARVRLAGGGVTDALLLQEGDQALISLGVFRDRSRADRVVARARGLGFAASVRDRFRPGVERWLLVQPQPGQSIQPEDLRLSEALILRAEPTPCDNPPPPGNTPGRA